MHPGDSLSSEQKKTEELLRDRTGSGTPDLFKDFDLVLFPYENEKGTTIKEVLRAATAADSRPKRIAVMIGPEGGFSDEEANAIVAAGGKSVSLGKTILRTETAGMTALAMIMYELEM